MAIKFIHTVKCEELSEELAKTKERSEYWCKLVSKIQTEYEDKLAVLQQKIWILEATLERLKKDKKE